MNHMKKNLFAYFLAAILAFVLTQPLVNGGSRTGSIVGEVTDPSGSVVPGATVLLFHDQFSETLTTDASGQFLAAGLAPGAYDLVVSSNGFAPLDRVGVMVLGGNRTKMDATLNLAVPQQVTRVRRMQSREAE
jgi:hypothetical protein